MSESSFFKLVDILNSLQKAKIYYRLHHVREDAILVEAHLPGQHWEIDIYTDGTVDIEIFYSDGKMLAEDALAGLIVRFTD